MPQRRGGGEGANTRLGERGFVGGGEWRAEEGLGFSGTEVLRVGAEPGSSLRWRARRDGAGGAKDARVVRGTDGNVV